MFRKLFTTAVILQLLTLCVQGQGILKRLGDKAANVGGDLIINKAKKKADKALDGKPGEKTEKPKTTKEAAEGKEESKSETNPATIKAEKKLATANSKFDFIPGEKIILFDNFEQDAIGEFPLKWFTNGSAEVVKLDDQQGKWMQFNSGSFLTPVMTLPENFTVEFDLFLNMTTKSTAVLPGFGFEFHDRGEKTKRLDVYNYELINMLDITTSFQHDKATVRADSREEKKVKIRSDNVFLYGFAENFGTVVHVAVSVQKERLRVWYNAIKVLDMPSAVALPHNFNQMRFHGEKTREGYPAFYISNFKAASGLPDMRSKLLEQGKYVTNGILFDVNSDKVKPESYGIIKEIATAIKETRDVKFRIIGHTDSDGNAENNMALSKKRAAAVKEILVNEFGVGADQLSTDGMGATQPVSSNSTTVGKAENRRVEFVKL
ncbi:MAG: OmpA family protein [Pseudobacter sp.]|uniref:OmpA family protein n=1 Tax=Pseudobacter sp. TaxID=2045420 RepID=UPI003F7EDA5E